MKTAEYKFLETFIKKYKELADEVKEPEKWCNALLEHKMVNNYDLIDIGDFYFNKKDDTQSTRFYQKALPRPGDKAVAYIQLGILNSKTAKNNFDYFGTAFDQDDITPDKISRAVRIDDVRERLQLIRQLKIQKADEFRKKDEFLPAAKIYQHVWNLRLETGEAKESKEAREQLDTLLENGKIGHYDLATIGNSYFEQKKFTRAKQWYDMAIESKQPGSKPTIAYLRLGYIYLYGYGVKQDIKKGNNYCRQALDLGDDGREIFVKQQMKKIQQIFVKQLLFADEKVNLYEKIKEVEVKKQLIQELKIALTKNYMKNTARLLMLGADKKDEEVKKIFSGLKDEQKEKITALQDSIAELLAKLDKDSVETIMDRIIPLPKKKQIAKQMLYELYKDCHLKPILDLIKLACLDLHDLSMHKRFSEDYDSDDDNELTIPEKQRFKIRIVSDAYHVGQIYHLGDGENYHGVFRSNVVYIGAKRDLKAQFRGVFFHELVHLVTLEVFKNGYKPYCKDDEKNRQQFTSIAEDLESKKDSLDPILQGAFSDFYKKENSIHSELIVRVVQIIVEYFSESCTGFELLERQAPALLVYYKEIFLKAVEKHTQYLESRALSGWPRKMLDLCRGDYDFASEETVILRVNPTDFKDALTDARPKLQDRLVEACEQGDLKRVQIVIDDGATPDFPDSKGRLPIGAAVWGMTPAIVKFISSKSKTSLSWDEIKVHNEREYKEIFIISNFNPCDFGEWWALIKIIDQSQFLRDSHFKQVGKVFPEFKEWKKYFDVRKKYASSLLLISDDWRTIKVNTEKEYAEFRKQIGVLVKMPQKNESVDEKKQSASSKFPIPEVDKLKDKLRDLMSHNYVFKISSPQKDKLCIQATNDSNKITEAQKLEDLKGLSELLKNALQSVGIHHDQYHLLLDQGKWRLDIDNPKNSQVIDEIKKVLKYVGDKFVRGILPDDKSVGLPVSQFGLFSRSPVDQLSLRYQEMRDQMQRGYQPSKSPKKEAELKDVVTCKVS